MVGYKLNRRGEDGKNGGIVTKIHAFRTSAKLAHSIFVAFNLFQFQFLLNCL